MDAGYEVVRLGWMLADLLVTLVGRLRSDRVFHAPASARQGPTKGRPPRHGAKLVLADPTTHPEPAFVIGNDTDRYGHAQARAFARIESRGGWAGHTGQLPIIEGTVLGLRVERLPEARDPKPVWLWASRPCPDNEAEVDHWWSMFLRRFDLEHTFEVPQADPGLDQALAAGARSGQPVNLAHPRRPHPTSTGQAPGRRPPAALAETTGPDQADPVAGEGRLSAGLRDSYPSRQDAETASKQLVNRSGHPRGVK